jgi:DNA-binding ferritin-like protein
MAQIHKLANLYVATLRALYLVEQNCHWKTQGLGFYGDHLLFERLYKSSADNADLAAEKMIGVLGDEGLNVQLQTECLHKLLTKYSAGDNCLEVALRMEKDFLTFSQQAYDAFEEADEMTLGLDDMLMEIASKHEEHCYLLQQSLKQEPQ